jgi:hypothetical protein
MLHGGFFSGLYFDPKMKATCFSETSADFQPAAWHYIPEDRILHKHSRQNLKSQFLRILEGVAPYIFTTYTSQHCVFYQWEEYNAIRILLVKNMKPRQI